VTPPAASLPLTAAATITNREVPTEDPEISEGAESLTSPEPEPGLIDDTVGLHPGPTAQEVLQEAASLVLPSEDSTPLYSALLQKLSGGDDDDDDDCSPIFTELADMFLFEKHPSKPGKPGLKSKRPHGSAEQPAQRGENPYKLGERVEDLLRVANTQRERQIDFLISINDHRVSDGRDSAREMIFSETDMQQVINRWMREPHTWMDAKSCAKMGRAKDKFHFCKSRFGAMLFQLFGNKHLALALIRVPICSTPEPAPLLRAFVDAWKESQQSPEVYDARRRSQQTHEQRPRQRMRQLEKTLANAEKVAAWVGNDMSKLSLLRDADRRLLGEPRWSFGREWMPPCWDGILQLERAIGELQEQQAISCKFPGIHSSVAKAAGY